MLNPNLGKRIDRTRAAARALRLCPVCGERKPPRAFRLKRTSCVLGVVCAECIRRKKPGTKEFFAARKSLTSQYRRFALVALRRLANKGKEVNGMNAEEYANKVAKLPDRIAAVVGKTYAVRGDAAEMADDEALMRIRDLADEIDPTLIERNKNKRLSRG